MQLSDCILTDFFFCTSITLRENERLSSSFYNTMICDSLKTKINDIGNVGYITNQPFYMPIPSIEHNIIFKLAMLLKAIPALHMYIIKVMDFSQNMVSTLVLSETL